MRRSAGFTLLEMLVAVAVLAIAMGAIISGMARYADNAARLREKTVALWVAHNRLTELSLQRAWPDIGKSDGEVEMAGVKWKWEVEVKATPDTHLRRADISVRPSKARNKDAVASLSAFLADSGRQ
ncbi:type II secretion system protein GspI [Solimonas fluminis]|uniref:Type II secretion system protein I n=1 Tax=Solimonas fluminis TaxID=2086571 RepID=A0A2S5TDU6_9GAMM|nr:type II secretion system minor pseudopilin GspI [Solimonas fluminis]PPE73161.1 type II secretion system protein GspI [Solimonas fluminis]